VEFLTSSRLGHGHSLPGPWPRRPSSLFSGASSTRPDPPTSEPYADAGPKASMMRFWNSLNSSGEMK
jgi:hypothetical protein